MNEMGGYGPKACCHRLESCSSWIEQESLVLATKVVWVERHGRLIENDEDGFQCTEQLPGEHVVDERKYGSELGGEAG